MNFELGPDEHALISAARDALSRTDTLAAARSALDGGQPADLWKEAVRGGWTDMPGLLYSVLVLIEAGRRLAPTGLLGHLTAIAALRGPSTAGISVASVLPSLLDGSRRASFVPLPPQPSPSPAPGAISSPLAAGAAPSRAAVETEHASGKGNTGVAAATDVLLSADDIRLSGGRADYVCLSGGRADYVCLSGGRADYVRLSGGRADFVPDAVGADVFVVGGPQGVFVADGVTVEPAGDYDRSRPCGNVRWTGGEPVAGDSGYAWDVAQTLLAAEALGASEAALELAVAYTKERKAFGRAIGSFQAIKHQLTDSLRLNENARSLLYYAAFAAENQPDEFGLAANAARFAADQAIEITTRRCLSVHGGLGATWEHDAHLYFRRAQLTRLLLGGQAGAGERVVHHVIPR